ncbi:MAG: hypothetical protein IIX01_00050 [Clostridia bacterium]|nr:hypothetical protein [Clostridia bacterium]
MRQGETAGRKFKKIDNAIIDVGSNSVRLLTLADGKVLYKTLETTRLGEGIAQSPFLKPEAIERTANAVADFYKRAKEEGAEKVYAFATAAVRSAKNGRAFVDTVKALCGLQVDIVSGEQEAELGISGALDGDGGVIDVGGASTEIVVKKQGETVYKKSVNIGVVRLKDDCGYDKGKIVQTAERFAEEFGVIPSTEMYAIGGTATTVGALIAELKEYSAEAVTGVQVTLKQMQELSDRLIKTPIEEIEKIPCVHPKRADVIGGGVTLLAVLMERLNIPKLTVSDADNLEGYAKYLGLLK